MLHRVFGLHGTGKSAYIYKKLEECVKEQKHSFLLVPEQQALLAERTLIDTLGNPANMYVEVINFKRLCNRVFRETGGVVDKTPDNTSKILAMSETLYELKDSMSEYGKKCEDPEFAVRMLEAVNDMHRCRITPEMLEQSRAKAREAGGEGLCNKINDLVLAYNGYEAYMTQTLDFPGDMLDKLYETLCSESFFEGKTVFLDSFYGFTPQESAIIEKMIQTASDVYVSFVCKSESHSDKCFARATSAAKTCKRAAEKYGVGVEDVFFSENVKHKAPSLKTVSERFTLGALSESTGAKTDDAVSIYKCEDVYEESKCAAKIASDLILSGVKPREIAVCAQNVADYEGVLDMYFESADIPISFDNRQNLASTPVASMVLCAFDVYFSWSMESVISYIKTGLSGLDDAQADKLEMYMRTWKISGKRYFGSEWYMNPEGLTESEPDLDALKYINDAKNIVFECLDGFSERVKSAVTARDFAAAAYGLIEDTAKISGSGEFDDRAGGVYLDLLLRTLDNIVRIVGNAKMTAKRFYDTYKLVIRSSSVGRIPEAIDRVRFSSVGLMRTDSVKHVIILGVNDGVFPKKPSGTEIFTSAEKKLLSDIGIELSMTDDDMAYDEIFLAYTALCSASEGAHVLYKSTGDDGKEAYPSVIVSILKKLTGSAEKTFPEGDITENALSDEQLFDMYMTMPDGVEKATVREYLTEYPAFAGRLAAAEREDFASTPLSERVRASLFGKDIVSSFSKIETYRKCPFSYFCSYTLRMNPERKAEMGFLETGNFVHKVLEEVIPIIRDAHDKGERLSDEQIDEKVRKSLSELLCRIMPPDSGAATKRFEYTYGRLYSTLCKMCRALAAELEVSKFVPADFELEISPAAEVKPYPIQMENGHCLYVIGKIDRVDTYVDPDSGETWVRVIDYKTGQKTFRIDDARNGFNLQMLLYLYTLMKSDSGKYASVRPAGILYEMTKRDEAKSELGKATFDDMTADEQKSSVSGLVVNDLSIIYAMDEKMSGKFVPLYIKKDGTLKASSMLIDESELAELLEEAAQTAGALAEEIYAGKKAAEPYDGKDHNPCGYCVAKGICPREDIKDSAW